jgi:hypothetical protein
LSTRDKADDVTTPAERCRTWLDQVSPRNRATPYLQRYPFVELSLHSKTLGAKKASGDVVYRKQSLTGARSRLNRLQPPVFDRRFFARGQVF